MKVIAINGSPRKNFNTAQLLQAFLDGAACATDDVQTELIHLYDYDYKGCTECYSCKLKNGPSYGKCAYPDDLQKLLPVILDADIVVFGSPIFFYDITGQLRSLLERLFYPNIAFKRDSDRILTPKRIRTAFIYTMNVTEQEMRYCGYPQNLAATHNWTAELLGYIPSVLYSYNTLQYSDYDKYVADLWDVEEKRQWHKQQFPKDIKSAHNLGYELAKSLL